MLWEKSPMFDFNVNAFAPQIKTHANMVSGAVTVTSTFKDLSKYGDIYKVVRAASHFLSSPHFTGRDLTVIADAVSAPLRIPAEERGDWTAVRLYNTLQDMIYGRQISADIFNISDSNGTPRLTLKPTANPGLDIFVIALQAARFSAENNGTPVLLNVYNRDVTVDAKTFPEEIEGLFSLHAAMRSAHQPARFTPVR